MFSLPPSFPSSLPLSHPPSLFPILSPFSLPLSFPQDKSSLPVKHFQFLGWPEESGKVPSHGADLIDLIGQVQKWQRTAGTAPVIVHCSGGSGRTGTFITIANLLDCLKSEGVVDVFQTVRTLRLQRPNMVRTVEQYRYCYTTVLEYLESFDLYANFK